MKRKSRLKWLFWGLMLFVVLLLLESANWFTVKFENLDLSVAVYQMLSPLKGTSTSVIIEFCRECLFPAIIWSVVVIVCFICYDFVTRRLFFQVSCVWKQKLNNSKKTFRLLMDKKFFARAKLLVIVIFCGAVLGKLCTLAVKMDLTGYIRSLQTSTNFIEEYYVAPENVRITFPEKKRNLIMIYMESMENTYASTEVGGGKPVNYIPELTDLALNEGVNFSNTDQLGGTYCISGASWTIAALLTYQTGVPYKLPVDRVDDYAEFLPGLTGLGELLENQGYHNYFMCGSDTVFGGRKNLFEQHGDYTIFDYLTAKEEGFIPENYYEFWGMEDKKLYEYAKEKLDVISKDKEPFNLTLLTVDTHFPNGYICQECDEIYEEQYANAIACASHQVAKFIAWAKEQEWYDNTTIVIVGDHLSMKDDFWDDIDGFDRRIYNCFYNLPSGISSYRNKQREFNACDFFPTIVCALGAEIEGERLGLGTNLFSELPTLQEELGTDEWSLQLMPYSKFYYDQFVIGN